MVEDVVPFASRTLGDPGFGDDDGAAPHELATALAQAVRLASAAPLVAALRTHRVLVPVVAVLDEVEVGPGGQVREKTADLAVVTVRAADGRSALPVFTSTSALASWHAEARPVPALGRRAALAAYDEGAEAILVDPAGPLRYVLEGPALLALAEGRDLVAPGEDPDVLAAVATAAEAAGVDASDLDVAAGVATDLLVRLRVPAGSDEEEVAARGGRLGRALAADPVLRSRLGRGLDLQVVATEA